MARKKQAESKKLAVPQGDYKIGNKKPPKEHQFKPSQSGNPKGAPAHRINLWPLFCKFMAMTDAELAELDRQRDQVASEAFGVLTQSLTKAVETLAGLLDNKDDRLKRLTAKDVIDFIIRHKENEDLDRRLTEIEKQLETRGQR